jgi:hypothetical protein
MLTRQTGHFFFEPNGYDNVNDVSNDYKEAVKVGYNQTRKIVLLTVWGLVPVALFAFPTLFGLFAEPASRMDFVRQVGVLWLAVGLGGGLVRVIQLFATQDVSTGLIWAFKVLTDPFHNIALYWKGRRRGRRDRRSRASHLNPSSRRRFVLRRDSSEGWDPASTTWNDSPAAPLRPQCWWSSGAPHV